MSDDDFKANRIILFWKQISSVTEAAGNTDRYGELGIRSV